MQPDQIPEQPAYTTKSGLAYYFGVSERTIDRWQKKRAIPFVKIGGQIRFKISEVEEALRVKNKPALPQPALKIRRRNVYHRLLPDRHKNADPQGSASVKGTCL